jgi:acylphosphatase
MSAKRRVRFKATGRVQGVAFRASARAEARRLGLGGFIRNLDDGAVAGEVEGPASAVDGFMAFVARGPLGARVDHVEREDLPLLDQPAGFVILHDGGA